MPSRPLRVLVLLFLCTQGVAQAADQWTLGENYFAIVPAQRTNVPAGKVEVTEVFSYGCPACYAFYPVADKLKAAMPANVEFDYLPASYSTAEAWPMYQCAYFTAQALGVDAKTHDAVFNAVWNTGEIGYIDPATKRPKSRLPTIEDAAAFYNRVAGVDKDKFVATSKSFGVAVKMKHADDLIRMYGADSTPTIVVNGKYRLNPSSAGGYEQTIALVKYLVAKESAGAH
jgi:thiol:disulfide interchange protein DsbA